MSAGQWVLDASVCIKWFFSNENDSDKALFVLAALRDRPDDFFVPDLFHLEVAAVLCKKSPRDLAFTHQALGLVRELGIPTFPSSQSSIDEAMGMSLQTGLSFYDAVYASLARSFHARWLTADARAVAKLNRKEACLLSTFR